MQGVVLETAGVVVEPLFQKIPYRFHLVQGGAVETGAAAILLTLVEAGHNGGSGFVVVVEFTVQENEKLVLDDGAADGEPQRIVECRGGGQQVRIDYPALECTAGEEVVNGAMPFVGAVLGDHIDGAALEIAVAHVEGGEVDVDLIDGFK